MKTEIKIAKEIIAAIKTGSYEEWIEKILDTHMGSQSSRIAAFNMGFDYWGWEIDAEYFKDGNRRFKEQTAQLQLL